MKYQMTLNLCIMTMILVVKARIKMDEISRSTKIEIGSEKLLHYHTAQNPITNISLFDVLRSNDRKTREVKINSTLDTQSNIEETKHAAKAVNFTETNKDPNKSTCEDEDYDYYDCDVNYPDA